MNENENENEILGIARERYRDDKGISGMRGG
jgi:hypothetical protein